MSFLRFLLLPVEAFFSLVLYGGMFAFVMVGIPLFLAVAIARSKKS